MKAIRRTLVAIVFIIFSSFTPVFATVADPVVLISEIKLGGAVSGQPTQFVELYNDSSKAIDLNSWSIEYAKANAQINPTQCAEPSWKAVDSSVNTKVLGGIVQPRGRIVFDNISLNDNTGGSLRLIKNVASPSPMVVVYDLVGWGNNNSPSVCFESEQTIVPPNGQSIKRIFDSDGHPVDTNNNSLDFNFTGQDPLPETDPPSEDDSLPPIEPDNPEPESYLPIVITEILPDPDTSPSGAKLSDDRDEFVELHNPNSVDVDIGGYKIKTGLTNQYSYTMPSRVVPAKGYYVMYSAETGLTLSNSGSKASVFAPNDDFQYSTEAYNSISKDVSWSYVDDKWLVTDRVTPGSANLGPTEVFNKTGGKGALSPCPSGKFRNPDSGRCKNIDIETSLKPCNSDQYRSPETNRCRKKSSQATSLKACAIDQYRSPETNRCRKISSTSTTLKPCKPDQYRSPETNRCRKLEVATGAKPCKEGYERNKETNRCRKVAGVNTGSGLSGVASTASNPVSYPVLGVVGVGVIGYGVFEYKNEISRILGNLRKK